MNASSWVHARARAALALLSLTLPATGCGKAKDSTTPDAPSRLASVAQIVRDAPGVAPTLQSRDDIPIAHFDSTAFTATTQLVVDSVPIALLARGDTATEFNVKDVDWAMLLSNNAVATHSRMATKLLVFDSTGRPLKVLTRFGTVPGEVGRRQQVARAFHDTLVIADFSNRHVNRYSAEKFVRMTPIGTVVDERADQLAGVLRDGTLVLHSAGTLPERFDNGRTKNDAMLMLMDTRGLSGVVADLPDISVAIMRSNWEGKKRPMPLPLRLGTQARVAVWDSVIATGNGESYRIDLRNDRGKVVSALEVAVAPRAVTQSMRDGDLAARLAEFEEWGGVSSMGRESLRITKAWPVADSVATFGNFFVTAYNTLWVTDLLVPGENVWHATAFNARHEMVGRLTYSGNGTPVGFGDDRVVLRTIGTGGVPTFSVHRLVARAVGTVR